MALKIILRHTLRHLKHHFYNNNKTVYTTE